MFTDRQKLHQEGLVTSDSSEEYSVFRVIRPIDRSQVEPALGLSPLCRVEVAGRNPGQVSHSFLGCNFLVPSHIVWPESDIHREQNSEISSNLGMTCDNSL
jgi:hypothetical protein